MVTADSRLIGFLCRWCSYEAADGAGRRRRELPEGFLPVRVPCAGRVSAELFLRAFREGADGVLVLGCHAADCHYGVGAALAERRVALLRRCLGALGVEPERLAFGAASAAEGTPFADLVRDAEARLRALASQTASAARRALR